MKSFLGIARANFLLLPVTLVAVGAAAAAYDGAFAPLNTLLALVGLTAMHAAVNSLNEYSDFRRGIDLATERTPFSGGSGTLPSGALPARAALYLGLGAASLGLVIGLLFLYRIGWVLLPVLLLGAISVLGYSDVLARAYVGEVFAGAGLGTLPVLGTALVQGGDLGSAALAASIPPFFMTFNLLLLNEFPDEMADRWGSTALCGRGLAGADHPDRCRDPRGLADAGASGLPAEPGTGRTVPVGSGSANGSGTAVGARRQCDLESGHQRGARRQPRDRWISRLVEGPGNKPQRASPTPVESSTSRSDFADLETGLLESVTRNALSL
jgi:hypothetical protein